MPYLLEAESNVTITIIGLGPGNPAQLTREAWEELNAAGEVYVRTAQHPTLAGLPAGLLVHSFDDLYETIPEFDRVYAAIAERVLLLGQRPQGVVYAVPGHPAVGEASVGLETMGRNCSLVPRAGSAGSTFAK